mmetsp:Transcript_86653/g.197761  ORF Transcript_86653/g.197761 Transcript_86653/m.197761 type:complete len:284 (+) Transcript_86653:2028-2879(+)
MEESFCHKASFLSPFAVASCRENNRGSCTQSKFGRAGASWLTSFKWHFTETWMRATIKRSEADIRPSCSNSLATIKIRVFNRWASGSSNVHIHHITMSRTTRCVGRQSGNHSQATASKCRKSLGGTRRASLTSLRASTSFNSFKTSSSHAVAFPCSLCFAFRTWSRSRPAEFIGRWLARALSLPSNKYTYCGLNWLRKIWGWRKSISVSPKIQIRQKSGKDDHKAGKTSFSKEDGVAPATWSLKYRVFSASVARGSSRIVPMGLSPDNPAWLVGTEDEPRHRN